MNRNRTMRFYLEQHLPLYIFVSVLFVMGVVFGALMVNSLTLEQKEEMARYLGSFFHAIDQGADMDSRQMLLQTFGMYMKWVILVWILGLSVVGLPLILILNFLKGVLIGFTVGFLIGQLSWKGVLFALASVAPQNLAVVPALIILSVTALSFSLFLIKNRLFKTKGSISKQLSGYLMVTLSMGGVMFAVSLFEAYVSPMLMKWVTPMVSVLY